MAVGYAAGYLARRRAFQVSIAVDARLSLFLLIRVKIC